jgi:two-component system sensor histidine kinase DesK
VTEPVAVNDRSTSQPPHHSRRHHIVLYCFLIALAGPVSDILAGTAGPAWLAALALGGFAACFATIIETTPHHLGALRDGRLSRVAVRLLRGTAFATLAFIAVATTLAYGTTWLVLFVFVVALFVSAVPFRLAPAAVCVVAALAVAASLSRSWNGATIDTAASWGLSIIFAGYITLLLHRRDVLIGELRVTQGEVARLAAADAVAEERLRFARDLHDLLGHSLSVIVLKTELAGRLFDSGAGPQARAEVGDAEEIARRSLAEVREAVSGYRRQSLGTEFEQARAALEAAGVQVSVVKMVSGLPADIDDLLGWVVREAATNVVRHSNARHAEIDLTMVDRAVRLEVADDGVGIPEADAAASDGSGLLGLRERVADMGGSFEAGGRSGGGFALRVTVPLGASAETANVALAADAKEAQS